MHAHQIHLSSARELKADAFGIQAAPDLGLAFANPAAFRDGKLGQELRRAYPKTTWLGCSTAGEISNQGSGDDGLLLSALSFDDPNFQVATTLVESMSDSYAAGRRLAEDLAISQPHTLLVLAPGTHINGSKLIEGLQSRLPSTRIAGGLAGDGAAFKETFTLCNESVSSSQVVVLGFSSRRLRTAFGSCGGWRPFGPARRVTRVTGNVLFELDDEPALDIYKRYLGDLSASLPASGLLFPFSILNERREEVGLIRTILAVDDSSGSLTLAGDVPADGYLQLMHASTDSLVQGATTAAEAARLDGASQGFGLLISCVGRKLVMGGRTDEEVDAVVEALGEDNVFAGFHSYGEISPGSHAFGCDLYNQTMTVSFMRED